MQNCIRLFSQFTTREYYFFEIQSITKAYQLIKESLINKLIELRLETYGDDKFIALAEKEIPKYTKLMKYAGFDVPEHLSSAEAFNNYRKEIRSL